MAKQDKPVGVTAEWIQLVRYAERLDLPYQIFRSAAKPNHDKFMRGGKCYAGLTFAQARVFLRGYELGTIDQRTREGKSKK
jgi:hypothetical protein